MEPDTNTKPGSSLCFGGGNRFVPTRVPATMRLMFTEIVAQKKLPLADIIQEPNPTKKSIKDAGANYQESSRQEPRLPAHKHPGSTSRGAHAPCVKIESLEGTRLGKIGNSYQQSVEYNHDCVARWSASGPLKNETEFREHAFRSH